MLSLSSLITSLTATGRLGATVIARSTLPSGLYAICDSNSEITWNSNSYLALGHAMQVQVPPTTSVGKQQAATIKISYDVDSLSTILAENYRRAPTTIAVLLKDLTTGAWVGEVPVFQGYLDTAQIDIAEGRMDQPEAPVIATLTFSVLPRSARLDQVGVRTRSDADQRAHRDANDGFFKDVGQAAKTQINWGRAGPSSPATTIGGVVATNGFSPQDLVTQVARRLV